MRLHNLAELHLICGDLCQSVVNDLAEMVRLFESTPAYTHLLDAAFDRSAAFEPHYVLHILFWCVMTGGVWQYSNAQNEVCGFYNSPTQ